MFNLLGLLCIIVGFVAAIIDERILFGPVDLVHRSDRVQHARERCRPLLREAWCSTIRTPTGGDR